MSLNTTSCLSRAIGAVRNNARWTLALLTLTYVFSYADRYAMAILAQPVKKELGLSDTAVGWLTGFAFSALYAFAALPIGRLADRTSRRKLLAWSLTAWTAMTCLCGAARNFLQLALIRMGVGVGEAGCVPSAHSLIADIFPVSRRALALGIFTAGGMVGMLTGFGVGGALEQRYGWRLTFVAIALPGFLVASVLALALPEPLRKATSTAASGGRRIAAELLAKPGFVWVLIGYGFVVLSTLGITQWLPAFYERSFSLDRASLGRMLAIAQGIGSIVGLLAGGWLSDRGSQRNVGWPLWQMIGAAALAFPIQLSMFLVGDVGLSMGGGFMAMTVAMMGMSPTFAVIQQIAPPDARATAAAMSLAVAALIGSGAGPLLVGSLSDALRSQYGNEALRAALVIVAAFAGLMAVTFYVMAALYLLRSGAPDRSRV